MTKKESERYEIGADGLRTELIGEWSEEKHLRLRKYVDATWAARRKFSIPGSTYIDLYCGPGQARIKGSDKVVDGSALVATSEADKHSPFSAVHVGDKSEKNLTPCVQRLRAKRVQSVHSYLGPADVTVQDVVTKLHPTGLHLALLDPYSIGALSFVVLRTLATLRHMDMLIHISTMDLQRNVHAYAENGTLETFAPGWASEVDDSQRNDLFVQAIFRHWRALLSGLGYKVSDNVERVSGSKNQPLYWLVLAARHELAGKIWGEISNVHPQRRLDL